MDAHLRWRRHQSRPGSGAGSRLKLLAVLAAPVTALAIAPVVRADVPRTPSSLAIGAGLLPSVLPTVCVGGVVLCPGTVVQLPLPTPVPVPVPSACVPGVVCTPEVVRTTSPGPTVTPTAAATAPPRPSGTSTPKAPAGVTAAGPGPGPGAVSLVGAPLPAPPGVGIVPLPTSPGGDTGLRPDSFENLLSLSLRDGLDSTRYHVWPVLLAIQLGLWTVIALVAWSRQTVARGRPA